ncbi:MAG TPA: hypothetical protein VM529_15955 [Gemmata sp.]|nr:hypothetical protein [Gemmata sp.]
MSCPTCDHTMERIGQTEVGGGIYLCPRCGTVKAHGYNGNVTTYYPKLVGRCREFERQLGVPGDWHGLYDEWQTRGIAESINTPENRKDPR